MRLFQVPQKLESNAVLSRQNYNDLKRNENKYATDTNQYQQMANLCMKQNWPQVTRW